MNPQSTAEEGDAMSSQSLIIKDPNAGPERPVSPLSDTAEGSLRNDEEADQVQYHLKRHNIFG